MLRLPTALLALTLCATAGCGTCFNMAEQPSATCWPNNLAPTLRMYGGLRYDVEVMQTAVSGGHFDAFDFAVYMPWFEYLLAVDMPLCLVADTVTLPWTLEATLERSEGVPRGYGTLMLQGTSALYGSGLNGTDLSATSSQ
jgi:uncharacterized protein YceK